MLIVGLEGLAIESVTIAPPKLLHGEDATSIKFQITPLASWLAIGFGTSLTLYTLFTRKPPGNTASITTAESETSTSLQIADLDYLDQLDSHDLPEADDDEATPPVDFEDDEQEDTEYDDDEDDDISVDDFNLDAFHDQLDIDDLQSE